MAIKVMAIGEDGQMSWCSASPENRGRYNCNHWAHREEGQTVAQFVEENQALKLEPDVLRRPDGPSTEEDGTKTWYKDGVKHREDGPAIEDANGTRSWYKNGKIHRDGDEPAVERADGTKWWYKNGLCHREDGPAVISANGTKEWYINGKRHRIEGPAIERADGRKFWYHQDELRPGPSDRKTLKIMRDYHKMKREDFSTEEEYKAAREAQVNKRDAHWAELNN